MLPSAKIDDGASIDSLTIISGLGYTVASAYMWYTSLLQMWWYPFQGKSSSESPWFGRNL
ncbi:hypothetical protein [Thalassotalea sp. ND16A]|uniref:hypothetical protein n=1 Tax=Thalassotalea sp. ND16A TaxID=1535422 RepID=UPI00051A38D0|nr:hypothetical protein [Thalassotalea sp. ND16A]